MKKVKLALAASLFFLILGTVAKSATITTAGAWATITIDATNLSAGIGSPLTSAYLSPISDVTFDITGTAAGAYNVTVKRTDILWPASVVLSVKRTGDGVGVGTIVNGNAAFQVVSTSDVAFFNGTDDRTTIPVQFEISNIDITIAPNTYSSTLTLTVTP